MISPDAIKRLNDAYGPRWHIDMPAGARQVDIKGETPITPVAPVAGAEITVCSILVPMRQVFVLQKYELQGFQDVEASWSPSELTREKLVDHAIVGKLAWRLMAGESLAYDALSKLSTTSEGHGLLGSYVAGRGWQPLSVSGRTTLSLSVRGIDPTAGINISPDGGQLVGRLSGYFLPIP